MLIRDPGTGAGATGNDLASTEYDPKIAKGSLRRLHLNSVAHHPLENIGVCFLLPAEERSPEHWGLGGTLPFSEARVPTVWGGGPAHVQAVLGASCAVSIALVDLRSESIFLDSSGGWFTMVTDCPVLWAIRAPLPGSMWASFSESPPLSPPGGS